MVAGGEPYSVERRDEQIRLLKQKIDDYERLHKILLTIGSSLTIDNILNQFVRGAVSLCGADEGAILLFDPAGSHSAKTLIRNNSVMNSHLDHYLNSLLSGWIYRHKKILITHDLTVFFGKRQLPQKYQEISSALSVPLIVRNDIIGVINLIRIKKEKPFDEYEGHLINILAPQCAQFIINARLQEKLFKKSHRLRREVKDQYTFHEIIGRSEKMQAVFTLLERILPTDSRVLLSGETGTGKELIARILHYNGPRRDKPFVAVDCGALPENLLESELFGYVKGAFTGAHQNKIGLIEEANGGTIFFDEIGNMPIQIQSKLLRAIETCEIRPLGSNQVKQVDVRIIAAASDDLPNRVENGSFRQDLFYRLNVVSIHLPPLRERGEDLIILANHFLKKMAGKYNKHVIGFRPETIAAMENYCWPGNVRELENVIERMVVLAPLKTTYLGPELLPAHFQILGDSQLPLSEQHGLKALKETFERSILIETLKKHNWNQSSAARELGISEHSIRYKIRKFSIRRK